MSPSSVVIRQLRQPLRIVHTLAAIGLFAVAHVASAQLADVKGSKDPAILKRYEGSTIIGYDFRKFDEFEFVLGPIKRAEDSGNMVPTKSQRVEGQATRILYTVPEGRSPLEVLRNYEGELQKNGFTVLYRCSRDQCGGSDGALAEQYLYSDDRQLSNTPPPNSGSPPGQVSEYAFSSTKEQQFITAKRSGPSGDAYASVYVSKGTFNMHPETFNHSLVLLDLVETAPMETKMVTVDAGAMAKNVATTGHVALYGIYFDHDKADIKPESMPTLDEIAKFLKQEPKLALFVVGHTDNVGTFEYNMGLSQRRAAAVVSALTGKYGIAVTRLQAAGVGPLAPVAANDAEEGKAKNRRVELVKR